MTKNLMQHFPEGGAPLGTALAVHSSIKSSDRAEGRIEPTITGASARVALIARMVRDAERKGIAPRAESWRPAPKDDTDEDSDDTDEDDTDEDVDTAPKEKPAKKSAKKKDKPVKKTKTKTKTPYDTRATASSKPVKFRTPITDPLLAAFVGSDDFVPVVNKQFRARVDARWKDRIAARGDAQSGGPGTTAPAAVAYPSMFGGAK